MANYHIYDDKDAVDPGRGEKMKSLYEPKISTVIVEIDTGPTELHTVVSINAIVVYLNDGSSAECSKCEYWREILEKEFDVLVDSKYPLFYFNRIKVKTESQGRGTVLIKALIRELDNRQVAVVATINPYGRMSEGDLVEWYSNYGFQRVTNGLLVRIPKGEPSSNRSTG